MISLGGQLMKSPSGNMISFNLPLYVCAFWYGVSSSSSSFSLHSGTYPPRGIQGLQVYNFIVGISLRLAVLATAFSILLLNYSLQEAIKRLTRVETIVTKKSTLLKPRISEL